jgi:hypothetical protein
MEAFLLVGMALVIQALLLFFCRSWVMSFFFAVLVQ